MIAVNSNCSRVDAVKAQATQLKLQSAGDPATTSADTPGARKVKADLQNLDSQIKTNDAQKAEQALSTAKKDLANAQTAAPTPSTSGQNFRSFSAYA